MAHQAKGQRGLTLHPRPSPGEEAAVRQAARDVVRDWLEFSTLRHYIVGLETMQLEESGDVLLRVVLRVPKGEIEWKRASS